LLKLLSGEGTRQHRKIKMVLMKLLFEPLAKRRLFVFLFVASLVINIFFLGLLVRNIILGLDDLQLEGKLIVLFTGIIVLSIGLIFLKPDYRIDSLYGIRIDWDLWGKRGPAEFIFNFGASLISLSLSLFLSLFCLFKIVCCGNLLSPNEIVAALVFIPQIPIYHTLQAWRSRRIPPIPKKIKL
jgi:hypothetical protein